MIRASLISTNRREKNHAGSTFPPIGYGREEQFFELNFFRLQSFKASLILLLVGMCLFTWSCSNNAAWTVSSPDGRLEASVRLLPEGKVEYSVFLVDSAGAVPLIGASPLGLVRTDGDFSAGLSFVGASPVSLVKDSFTLVTGKQLVNELIAHEITFTFANRQGKEMQVIFRAYDNGVAFRYAFPGPGDTLYTVEQEITGFRFPLDGRAWMQPYDKVTQWTPAYETYYENGIPIGTRAPGEEGWAFPALFETSGAWVLLTEAAVDSSYFAAHLQPAADSGLYTIRMPEESEASGLYPQRPSSVLPWMMPWRVMMIGKELHEVVESNLVPALNPAGPITDVSWIRPGRASWSWWSDPASPRNYASMKSFIDLAAEMGWEYFLVDANWDLMTGGNINKLVEYANSRKVGILMWYNSGGAHNTVTERPRDIMADPVKRRAEFRKLADWGVKGVKVDFFQSDKQGIIKQYFDILKDAADNKILVNFHGCTLPRGWNRTWPNLVSMEAVRGAECYIFDAKYPETAPWHNTVLPFVRNVVGSMDYTPVTFSNQQFPNITSDAYELALSVVFESGIVHFADRVSAYQALPEGPKNLLKDIPVVWDETLLLAGEPGKYCIMARRNGDTWYVAGINGTSGPQRWMVDMVRLQKENLKGTLIADGAEGKGFISSEVTLQGFGELHVEIAARGGFVAVLK